MHRKHMISTVLTFFLLAGFVYMIYVPERAKSEVTLKQPTVFVHGYKGTINSFGHMLSRFEHDYNWGRRALVYRVSPEGKLNNYQLKTGDNKAPAFVQIIFEDNRANFKDTTAWLAKVMAHMKSNYQIDRANLVGHSMGGLVSMNYIQDFQAQSAYPDINKFVSIGSPYNGIYNDVYFRVNQDPAAEDLKPMSHALKTLHSANNAIPETIEVLSIGSTGDSVAAPESVGMIRNIIDEAQLTYKMVNDNTLGHSELHEDVRVDNLIYSFLQNREMGETTAKD